MRRREVLGLGILAAAVCSNSAIARPRFSGRRIDIELQDASLDTVLERISDLGRVNIVKQNDVRGGKINAVFKSTPWDEVLYLVLQSQKLEMVRDGNIIYVCPAR